MMSIWPVKKLSDEMRVCYLSGVRCKWFAYIAQLMPLPPHHLLLH